MSSPRHRRSSKKNAPTTSKKSAGLLGSIKSAFTSPKGSRASFFSNPWPFSPRSKDRLPTENPPRSSLPGLDCPQSSISVPGGNAFLTDDHNPFWTGSEALALSDVPGGSLEANMLPSPLPLPDTLGITPADEFTDIDSEDDEAAPERQENKKARPVAQANNSIVNILSEAPYVCSQSSTASL